MVQRSCELIKASARLRWVTWGPALKPAPFVHGFLCTFFYLYQKASKSIASAGSRSHSSRRALRVCHMTARGPMIINGTEDRLAPGRNVGTVQVSRDAQLIDLEKIIWSARWRQSDVSLAKPPPTISSNASANHPAQGTPDSLRPLWLESKSPIAVFISEMS